MESARARFAPLRVVMRLMAVLMAAVQLGVAVAPILDEDTGRSAVTHIEELGVRQHWAHDAAECAGCAVRHLTPTPSAPPVFVLELAATTPRFAARAVVPAARPHLASAPSRAPPVEC